MMKKNIIGLLIAAIVVSSCDTYTGAGAYAGSQVGGMLGSFIGGISGGWRGSDVGGIIGMASGAVVGAAVGAATDEKVQAKERERVEAARRHREQYNRKDQGQYSRRDNESYDDNYLDESNSGDDRIDFTPSDGYGPTEQHHRNSSGFDAPVFVDGHHAIEVRRVRFIDSNGRDNSLSAGELSKISMEIFNTTGHDIYNVQAVLENVSNNKHVQLSAPVSVERIAAGKGVRYTAMIRADKRLKNGTVTIKAYALQNGKQISKTELFTLVTKRR